MQEYLGIYHLNHKTINSNSLPPSFTGSTYQNVGPLLLSAGNGEIHHSTDGQLFLLFHGRIYNLVKIQELLAEEGQNTSGLEDIAIVSAAISHWREQAFNKFEGMFAIAALFKKEQELLLARDHTGICTMTYQSHNNEFSFASSSQALKHFWTSPPPVNLPALHHYLSFGHPSSSIHLLEGLHTLPPGHFLWAGHEPTSYWNPRIDNVEMTPQHFEAVQNNLLSSITAQAKSDQRVGIVLNGKTSTAVMAALASKSNPNITLFNFNYLFLEDALVETKKAYAKKIAKACGLKLLQIDVKEQEVAQHFAENCHKMDTAHAAGSYHSLSVGYEKIKEDVDILLNANGANIIFSIHKHYQIARILEKSRTQPMFIGKLLSAFDKFAKQGKRWFKLKEHERIFDAFLILSKAEVRRLLLDDYNGKWHNHTVDHLILNNEYPLSTKMQWFDLKDHLPGHGNWITNKSSRRFELESRYPFQNPKLIESILMLNENCQVHSKKEHILLTKVVSEHVPKEVLEPYGFQLKFPYGKIIKNHLTQLAHQELSEESMDELRLFNSLKISNYINRHQNDEQDLGHALWTLLTFAVWYQQLKTEIKPITT